MSEMSGPLIADIDGLDLSIDDREVLANPRVGGIILFSRNYDSTAQLSGLCKSLKALPRKSPLVITVDHEGGRVQRFREGFTALPAAAVHGRRYGAQPSQALEDAKAHGATIARELRACGVDLSFAPVLDLDRGLGSVIGDRAFCGDPTVVGALGIAWIDGMVAEGMATCGKHFPGHGGVAGDSHHELPTDPRPLEQIMASDMVPFKAAVNHGLSMVMMAHVLFPEVDALPASLSRRWIRDILRRSLGFSGVVVCDDLSMAGAAGFGTYLDRAMLALEAGCDWLPVCNNRDGVIEVIDGLG